MDKAIPKPAVMPVDREKWRREVFLSNFVNTSYQYRDLRSCGGDIRKVLIVGPGQGLDTQVLRWLHYDVTTFDIDEAFQPDHVGSVHEMTMFGEKDFDAVIASHVLEHLPVPYLETALGELARVARFALVYLPIAGRHVQLRFIPGFREIDISLNLDLFNWLERPDGVTPRYQSGQHFWEIGMRGWRLKDVLHRLSKYFHARRVYRNQDWPSQNFVLEAR